MRVKGHKLVELTNEGGGGVVDGRTTRGRGRERHLVERSWTFRCSCGAQEGCRRKQDAIFEYQMHLRSALERQKAQEIKDQSAKVDHLIAVHSPGAFMADQRLGRLEREAEKG